LKLSGVITPIFTHYADNGQIDERALSDHVDWLIERGIQGVMPCGTTGEGALLTLEERKRVCARVVEVVDGRALVLAHVGTPSTRTTIELALHAAASGADAVSVVTPYYCPLPDQALVKHFCDVADVVSDLPVLLYNIPQCTGNALSRQSVDAIVSHSENVLGIKDSSGDLETLLSCTSLRNGDFQVVCGSDGLLLQALQGGACATVSGNSNVFPEVLVALVESFHKGDISLAQQQQTLLDHIREAMLDGRSISLMKHVLNSRGLHGGSVRAPLPEASPSLIAETHRKLGQTSLAPLLEQTD
jgi:4-hydroxy-tetrahydrodipicolinate synthase